MILQSLVRYYEILAEQNLVPSPGYCMAKVSYALHLSPDGELLGIVNVKEHTQRGKKEVDVPKVMRVPAQAIRAVNVTANFLCDNSGYFLGIDGKGKPERAKECFSASRELHEKVLSAVEHPAAVAVLRFFEKWNPETAAEHPVVREKLESLTEGGFLIFTMDGAKYVQDEPEIQKAWEVYCRAREKGVQMQCLVTGREEPVAILHGKIKGVKDAQSAGANLVSFNASAYESYGREGGQGLNAPVGEYAAFAYATVLNHLLADKEHVQIFGDTTVIYWAESALPEYRNIFTAMINPQQEDENQLLHSTMEKLRNGRPVADNISLSTPFCILGLAPNAARISVRFFLQNTFGDFLKNIRKHYDDLEITKAPYEFPYLTPYWLLRETVNPNSKDKSASPLLSGEVMRAIFTGGPYPKALLEAVMLRIRAEQDNEDKHTQKITSGRAAILKAYLIRSSYKEKYKEVLIVPLNEASNIQPYVLGRLFAVLEKAQKDANPGINSTIKDRYFSSACATPANVFATLFKLYESHIEKLKKQETMRGIAINTEKQMGLLLDKLEVKQHTFPTNLSLEDQAVFVLGYYQQIQNFYIPKDKKESREEL